MEAFVSSFVPWPTTAPTPHSHLGVLRSKPPAFVRYPRVARRRRLQTCVAETPPHDGDRPEGGGSEPKSVEEDPDREDPDTGASDLALPNLRELFAGAGRPGCEQCDGKGVIVCPVCDGKGYISLTMMDTTSSTQCRMCRGKRVIPCPSCRDIVYKSVVWWDQIPSEEDDPEEKWREGPDGEPRIPWSEPPAG